MPCLRSNICERSNAAPSFGAFRGSFHVVLVLTLICILTDEVGSAYLRSNSHSRHEGDLGGLSTQSIALANASSSISSPPRSWANASYQSLEAAARKEPVLVFLFLVYDKINNEEIWDRFFAQATQGLDYRALVHCKFPDACRNNIKSQHRYLIIPSVETKYCSDLVSGMNALLQSGLTYTLRNAKPDDKFIFISDSTLPVKPFSVVKSRLLTTGANSNFCIFPRNEWAEIQETTPGIMPSVRAAVKTHQWIILSRPHAEHVMSRSAEYRDLMTQFHINSMAGSLKNTGCLDEYWYFAILFGTIAHATNPQSLQLSGLNGMPLSTTDYEIQGQCDTFVQWVPRASGTVNNMTRLIQRLANDPGVDMTAASDKRPAAFHRFSLESVRSLRESWFMFARKVDDNAGFSGCDRLVDVFDKVIFSDPPQPMTPVAPYAGDGNWKDTRNAIVRVTASDGSVRLTGAGPGMDAKGTYCHRRIDVVFTNGYRAGATLSDDSMMLNWDTGVTWRRA